MKFSQYVEKGKAKKWLESGHDWIVDEDGYIDIFATCEGTHNGPACKRCGYAVCWHCVKNPAPCKYGGQQMTDPKLLRDIMAANERIRQRTLARLEWLQDWSQQECAEFDRLLDKYDERKRAQFDLDMAAENAQRARDI